MYDSRSRDFWLQHSLRLLCRRERIFGQTKKYKRQVSPERGFTSTYIYLLYYYIYIHMYIYIYVFVCIYIYTSNIIHLHVHSYSPKSIGKMTSPEFPFPTGKAPKLPFKNLSGGRYMISMEWISLNELLESITMPFYIYNYIYICLVGGFNPSEKYESQLGGLFPIYGKIKNVPNHQLETIYVIIGSTIVNEWDLY